MPSHRVPRPRTRLLGTTVAATMLGVGALAGCSGGTSDPQPSIATPAPTVSASSPAVPPTERPDEAAEESALAELARSGGTPVQAGSVTLRIAALTTPIGVGAQADGSVVVTIIDGAAAVSAPAGSSFGVRSDGSVVVVDADGDNVGALSPARAVDGSGVSRAVRFAAHATDPGLLEVVVATPPPGATADDGVTVTFILGADPLLSLDWGEREGGRSLAVVPAQWARAGGLAARDALWAAVVAAEPEADTPSMLAQFGCHALGAPDKDSWNLEPWRPEVNSFTLLATRCNP